MSGSGKTTRRALLIGGAAATVATGSLLFAPALRRYGSSEPRPVGFQLSWFHNGLFAGYYAADRKGHFADEGLAVRFLEGGPTVDSVERVVTGEADLGTASAGLLIRSRMQGKPVRAIAAIHQRDPTIFLYQKGRGIRHPRDFAGKTIAASRVSEPVLAALMQRVGVAPGAYRVVTPDRWYPYTFDGIDVWVGFLFDTEMKMRAQGFDVDVVYPDNFGVHFYRNCIFATDETIRTQPDMLTRFLRAVLLKGLPYAVEHPAEAGPLTASYAPSVDVAHETRWMTGFIPLIDTGQDPIGWMRPEIWRHMLEVLSLPGAGGPPLRPSDIHTMRFLEDIYAGRGSAGNLPAETIGRLS